MHVAFDPSNVLRSWQQKGRDYGDQAQGRGYASLLDSLAWAAKLSARASYSLTVTNCQLHVNCSGPARSETRESCSFLMVQFYMFRNRIGSSRRTMAKLEEEGLIFETSEDCEV